MDLQNKFKKIVLPTTIIAIAVQFVFAQVETPIPQKGYKLPEKCAYYYRLAQQSRKDPIAVLYCDSMRMEATKVKDNYAYIVAINEAVNYYVNTYDIANMDKQARRVRKEALRLNYPTYFYRTYQIVIKAHLGRHAFSNALQIADEMRQTAIEQKSEYGIWLGYRTLAEIYEAMDNQMMKRSALQNVIDSWRDTFKAPLTPFYTRLAETEPSPQQRAETLEKGLTVAKTYYDTAAVNSGYMKLYIHQKEKKKFVDLFDKVKSDPRYPNGYSRYERVVFTAFETLVKEKNREKAINILESEESVGYRLPEIMSLLYSFENDYEKSMEWHLRGDSIRKTAEHNVMVSDLYAYNVRVHGDSLSYAVQTKEAELKAINAERDRAAAENARLQAEQQKNASEKAKVLAEAQKKETELKLLKTVSERNKLALRESQQKQKNEELLRREADRQTQLAQMEIENNKTHVLFVILVASFILLLTILLMLAFYINRKNKTLKDIEQLNGKLKKAQETAEHASAMKDLFVQNMSHEIRTPLNAIVGFSQILTCQDITLTEKEKEEYGQHIMNNVKMLTMLVDDILNISDIETGTFSITLQETEIAKICEAAISVTQYRVPGAVQFRYINELPDGYSCKTDSRRAQQVLVNYITNACKHTKAGHIELKTQLTDNGTKLLFSVEDTGTGIPKEQSENIFERFTKLDSFKQGTGLGLNICRNVAQKLDGRLWLDTSYTNGARFCFEIPVTH